MSGQRENGCRIKVARVRSGMLASGGGVGWWEFVRGCMKVRDLWRRGSESTGLSPITKNTISPYAYCLDRVLCMHKKWRNSTQFFSISRPCKITVSRRDIPHNSKLSQYRTAVKLSFIFSG